MSQTLENSFLSAIEQNQQKLLRICSVYAKDDEDLKVLYQEVLIHIWEETPSIREDSSLEVAIFRLIQNTCLRLPIKPHSKKNKLITEDKSVANTQKDPEGVSRLATLKNCILQLNEADKALITLYLEELSYKQISEVIGLAENVIKMRVEQIQMGLLDCSNQTLTLEQFTQIWKSSDNEQSLTFEKSTVITGLQGYINRFNRYLKLVRIFPFLVSVPVIPVFIFYIYWVPPILSKIASALIAVSGIYLLYFVINHLKQIKTIAFAHSYLDYLSKFKKVFDYLIKVPNQIIYRFLVPVVFGFIMFFTGFILHFESEKQKQMVIFMMFGSVLYVAFVAFLFKRIYRKRFNPKAEKIDTLLKLMKV